MDGRRAEKVLQKIICYYMFLIIKNVFHYMFAKFFLPNSDACDLQPAVSSFVVHGHKVQYWHTQQVALRLMVILSRPLPINTLQSFLGAKDSSLGRLLYGRNTLLQI